MKILWLSMSDGLLNKSDSSNYKGIGWIISLQQLLCSSGHELGFAYISSVSNVSFRKDGTVYYPIYEKPKTAFDKFKEYYGGYRKNDPNKYLKEIMAIINDFRPQVIHLFGLENPMSGIIGHTGIPVIVHLQGLPGPINNAFFPQKMCEYTFLNPPTVKEWIYRNGVIYGSRIMRYKSEYESDLYSKVTYFMGRTNWDYDVTRLLSPNSVYFHVDEVMRQSFYINAGKWRPHGGQFTIISTLSPVAYKGLDVVLKTAKILCGRLEHDFRWQVVGIPLGNSFIRQIEKAVNIKSSEVNVSYLGVLDEQRLSETLLKSSVFVHPSYIENSSNSICEAQLLGIPVVCTNVGGTSSLIVEGETGNLVPSNGVYELAYRLLLLSGDINYCKRIGENAYQSAIKRHNKEKILTELLRAYETVVLS